MEPAGPSLGKILRVCVGQYLLKHCPKLTPGYYSNWSPTLTFSSNPWTSRNWLNIYDHCLSNLLLVSSSKGWFGIGKRLDSHCSAYGLVRHVRQIKKQEWNSEMILMPASAGRMLDASISRHHINTLKAKTKAQRRPHLCSFALNKPELLGELSNKTCFPLVG